MIWFATKGVILRKISSGRWLELESDKELRKAEREELLASRKICGIERETLITTLIDEQYSNKNNLGSWILFLKYLAEEKFVSSNKTYLYPILNDLIDTCISEGLVQVTSTNVADDCLKITEPGKKRASHFYLVTAFFQNEHIKQAISTLIQWGIPIIALYVLTQILNFNLEVTK